MLSRSWQADVASLKPQRAVYSVTLASYPPNRDENVSLGFLLMHNLINIMSERSELAPCISPFFQNQAPVTNLRISSKKVSIRQLWFPDTFSAVLLL